MLSLPLLLLSHIAGLWIGSKSTHANPGKRGDFVYAVQRALQRSHQTEASLPSLWPCEWYSLQIISLHTLIPSSQFPLWRERQGTAINFALSCVNELLQSCLPGCLFFLVLTMELFCLISLLWGVSVSHCYRRLRSCHYPVAQVTIQDYYPGVKLKRGLVQMFPWVLWQPSKFGEFGAIYNLPSFVIT